MSRSTITHLPAVHPKRAQGAKGHEPSTIVTLGERIVKRDGEAGALARLRSMSRDI